MLATEIGIAAFVHDEFVRPHLGDSLAVVLVYLVLRAVTGWRWPVALAAALAFACAIEVGQMFALTTRLGLDGVPGARVVLGSAFDLSDFAAYAFGAVGVAVVERAR